MLRICLLLSSIVQIRAIRDSSRSALIFEEHESTKKVPLHVSDVAIFSDEILEILGIDEPSSERSARAAKEFDASVDSKKVATEYMKTLYGQLEDERALRRNHLLHLKNADTIMSFGAKNIIAFGQFTSISFDLVENVPSCPQFVQLHLNTPHSIKQIDVFIKRNGQLLEYVSETPNSNSISVNITKEFCEWRNNIEPELYIRFISPQQEVVSTDFSAFCVAAYESAVQRTPLKRKKRNAPREATAATIGHVSMRYENPNTETKIISASKCNKQGLYVDFKDLGWKEWVIAPDGFSAFRCDGACPSPMTMHMNATNHAIVQLLLHELHPERVAPPRCVPTSLAQQKIIFYDNVSNVVIKKYKDMIVQECGCN